MYASLPAIEVQIQWVHPKFSLSLHRTVHDNLRAISSFTYGKNENRREMNIQDNWSATKKGDRPKLFLTTIENYIGGQ